MNILSMENVAKGYTENYLFEKVSLGIDDNDRIGLVGINGTGKTTLLKIISGQVKPDAGNIIHGKGMRVQCLSQDLQFDENMSVLEHILQGDHPLMKTIRGYETVIRRLTKNPEDIALQKQLAENTAGMDAMDAWNFDTLVKSILSKLGILDMESKISELSGGQRKRIALAEALIQPADLLILDEPTNHIDFETIKWLEDYLSQRRGALLLVTHDRYFLNRVVNRIVEIDRGRLYCYEGNFEYFLEKKTLREEAQTSMDEKRKRLYLNELKWIRRGAKARTTKQKARISRFDDLKTNLPDTQTEQMVLPVAYTRLGNKVIEFHNVSKSFDRTNIIRNFSTIINPDDRIGVVGPNGSGKTTLLNLIAGLILPDSGEITKGETVRISYYRQNNEDMDYSIRMIDYIKQTAEYVEANNGYKISAGQMLERFLFDGSKQRSFIKNLSGGEKRRLLLAKVLIEKPNVLLLDEPTNDLDIQTLEVLEEYLEYFRGAVIVVSHDRYFLDKTTDKLISVSGDGRVEFHNDLDSYGKSLISDESKKISQKELKVQYAPEGKRTKFTYSESREYSKIEAVISKLEEELKKTEYEMSKTWSDYTRLQELDQKQKNIKSELAQKIERWEYLSEIANKI
ncbi:MAG: ABC-F family ATP-binding cassette domain-containing protein [Candidatus Humimicrobiaceae bacterium]